MITKVPTQVWQALEGLYWKDSADFNHVDHYNVVLGFMLCLEKEVPDALRPKKDVKTGINTGTNKKGSSVSEKKREFESGATRNSDNGKFDYEAFLCPAVLERYAQFMHKHRLLEDGSLRPGDNWQKGIPFGQLLKSMCRHHMDVRLHQRGFSEKATEPLEDSLCAIIFNAMGMLRQCIIKSQTPTYKVDWEESGMVFCDEKDLKEEGDDMSNTEALTYANPDNLPHVYIAGPMRGLPGLNWDAFDRVADRAREDGLVPISPADLDRKAGISPTSCMNTAAIRACVGRDLDAICSLQPERGDMVAVLGGWITSVGATAEVKVARWLGLNVVYAFNFKSEVPKDIG